MGKGDKMLVTERGFTLELDGELLTITRYADGAEGKIQFEIFKIMRLQRGRRCKDCKQGRMVFAIGGMPLTLGLRCNACGTTYWPDEDIMEKLATRARKAQFN